MHIYHWDFEKNPVCLCMCVCVPYAVSSHVNRAIIHEEEQIHSQGLTLLAGDDRQAFQRMRERWKE